MLKVVHELKETAVRTMMAGLHMQVYLCQPSSAHDSLSIIVVGELLVAANVRQRVDSKEAVLRRHTHHNCPHVKRDAAQQLYHHENM
jgi:hypothetical protein